MNAHPARLAALDGTRWIGSAELWVDPLGNEVETCSCTMTVDGNVLRYTWSHDGTPHTGSVTLHPDGADFTDSWHQPEPLRCRALEHGGAVFQALGRYGPDAVWGWRIALSVRAPTGELVLQMTNIAPWGEEARAVRMVGRPDT